MLYIISMLFLYNRSHGCFMTDKLLSPWIIAVSCTCICLALKIQSCISNVVKIYCTFVNVPSFHLLFYLLLLYFVHILSCMYYIWKLVLLLPYFKSVELGSVSCALSTNCFYLPLQIRKPWFANLQ